MSAFGDPDPGRELAHSRSVASAERVRDDAHADGLTEIDETEAEYLSLIDEAVEPVFGSSKGWPERVARYEADKAALDAALDAISAIDATHNHIVGIYRSIAGKNPPPFKRINADTIRTGSGSNGARRITPRATFRRISRAAARRSAPPQKKHAR